MSEKGGRFYRVHGELIPESEYTPPAESEVTNDEDEELSDARPAVETQEITD